ncbi:MAG: hypothetical protein WC728_08260 [Elusimicrobiota bacterium]
MTQDMLARISTDEAPFLMRQVEEYRRADLHDYTVVNNTPLTMSAIVKMMPFIKNGFKLKTSTPSFLAQDPAAIRLVQEMGYEFIPDKERLEGVDIVLDCCAELSSVGSAKAAAELTRTGVDMYRRQGGGKPVLSVDDSKVKALETYYGTGDGFVRAFKEFVSPDIARTRFLIFGFGKVGKGIVRGLEEHSAACTLVDEREEVFRSPVGRNAKKVLASDIRSISGLLKDHDALITCTGKNHFLSETPWAEEVSRSGIKLINMGAEDEFGPRLPDGAAPAGRMPINHRLKRPTLLKYLDPVFYAHNSVVALYHDKRLASGLQPLPKDIDERLVKEWHSIWGMDLKQFDSVCSA